MEKLRIAAFGGFRSIPPKAGAAGSDKFAFELYPRIVKNGHDLIAYCRIYPGDIDIQHSEYEGIKIKYFKTVKKAGFDTLVHSAKATFHVIFRNTADVIHLHSGANSIWALLLRIAGKRVVVSQFAMDWKRDKWPWYGKLFYIVSNYLTAYCPNAVAFDNVFTKEYFEKKFNRKYEFVPYGSEVKTPPQDITILDKLGITQGEYFLFVGRFIPDKGLHLLVEAFSKIDTTKKLVLIGGSPNPSEYEAGIKNTSDKRILFPGYVYGDDTNILMKNAYAYVQPSLIEGLSPVILTVMGLGTPLICSDIVENKFICGENAVTFISGNSADLAIQLDFALNNQQAIKSKAALGAVDIANRFNWDKITDKYIELLKNKNKLMLKIALIGAGKMGISHLAILGGYAGAEIVGVCDTSKMVTDFLTKHGKFNCFSDYNKMLDAVKPDAVVVAVPTKFHYSIIKDLLEKKIHVFAEKPFCLNYEQSQELVQLAAKNKVVNQVGYHNKFIGTFQEVKRIAASGALGDIYHFIGESYGPVVLKKKAETWRSDPAEGGGCLLDYASHVIDLLNDILSPISAAKGTLLKSIYSGKVEDAVYSLLELESGQTGLLSVNWSDDTYRKMSTSVTLVGTQGKLISDANELKVFFKEENALAGYVKGWNVKYITELEEGVDFYLRGEEYSAQLDYFVKAANGEVPNNINNFASAANTDKAISIIKKSSK